MPSGKLTSKQVYAVVRTVLAPWAAANGFVGTTSRGFPTYAKPIGARRFALVWAQADRLGGSSTSGSWFRINVEVAEKARVDGGEEDLLTLAAEEELAKVVRWNASVTRGKRGDAAREDAFCFRTQGQLRQAATLAVEMLERRGRVWPRLEAVIDRARRDQARREAEEEKPNVPSPAERRIAPRLVESDPSWSDTFGPRGTPRKGMPVLRIERGALCGVRVRLAGPGLSVVRPRTAYVRVFRGLGEGEGQAEHRGTFLREGEAWAAAVAIAPCAPTRRRDEPACVAIELTVASTAGRSAVELAIDVTPLPGGRPLRVSVPPPGGWRP